MTRVVADTNILISAILFRGLPGSFLDSAIDDAFLLVTSPTLLDELEGKFLAKFKLSSAQADSHRHMLEELCDIVSTIPSLAVIHADPDDDRVLECAIASRADYIISGDRHLLNLSSYEGIPILTVRQFMDRLLPTS